MDNGIYDCDTCWNPFELYVEIERDYQTTEVSKNPAHQEHETTDDYKGNPTILANHEIPLYINNNNQW